MAHLQKQTLPTGIAGMRYLKKNLPLISVLIIWLVVGASGTRLLNRSSPSDETESGSSIYLLGPARALLSENLYERADTYYHKGAPHKKDVAFVGIFQKWKQAISPVEVQHAKDSEILEIMPWLRLATATDPKNIEAYRVAAYWLSHECNKPGLALNVLNEAAEKNPNRYEIQLEIGRMHLYRNDMEAAATAFDRSLDFLEKHPSDDPEQADFDRALLLTLRSFLYELHGNAEGALTMARLNMEFNPDREGPRNRVAQLQAEPLNPGRASEQIATIFGQTDEALVCNHEEHVHDEHCEHDHEPPPAHVHDENCSHEAHIHDEHCNHD
jgi:hypothetical protein